MSKIQRNYQLHGLKSTKCLKFPNFVKNQQCIFLSYPFHTEFWAPKSISKHGNHILSKFHLLQTDLNIYVTLAICYILDPLLFWTAERIGDVSVTSKRYNRWPTWVAVLRKQIESPESHQGKKGKTVKMEGGQ